MKVIKITPDEVTEWRANSSHLVSDEGEIINTLDPSLEGPLAIVIRTARQRGKSMEQKIKVGKLEATVNIEITRTGRGTDEYTLETRVGGYRIVSGREIICARMLAQHGECQLRHPNGVIMKVIRDPSIRRPTYAESMQRAPKPDSCHCRTWGKPHPGVHYQTCPWNSSAPAEERAPAPLSNAEVALLPKPIYSSLARTRETEPTVSRPDPKTVIAEAMPLDHPDTCRNRCLEWPTPKGVAVVEGQHHPTCVMAQAWAVKTSKETLRYLVDLRTGDKVRPASDQETGQAEINAKRSGSPIINVDNTPYAVLSEDELEQQTSVG